MSGGAWQAFKLIPDDVLFFRDGKPSTRGSDHYLRSLFPPFPSTLYGAIRTWRLQDAGIDLRDLDQASWQERLGPLAGELGDWGGFGSLELRGPWLVRDDEILLPAPADLGLLPEKTTGKNTESRPRISTVVRFRPPEQGPRDIRWSHALGLLLPYELAGGAWKEWPRARSEPRAATGWYLTAAGFEQWRLGTVPSPDSFVHPADLWENETRTGIGMESDRRTGKQGQLYTFGFIRLRDGVGLGFEIKGTTLRSGARVRLGGEGRTAVLHDGPRFPESLDASAEANGTLSLSLITPALSAAGAIPSEIGMDRLLAAAVPGFITIGGWDLAKQRPKALRRAIPAGSVFLIDKAAGQEPALHGTCLSDYSGDGLAKQGFGLAALGVSL